MSLYRNSNFFPFCGWPLDDLIESSGFKWHLDASVSSVLTFDQSPFLDPGITSWVACPQTLGCVIGLKLHMCEQDSWFLPPISKSASLTCIPVILSSVQSLSRDRLFATPWTGEHQASLSITNSRSLLKLMSIGSVMPSNHLTLCHPFLLLPSIFPSTSYFLLFSPKLIVF